MSDNLKRYRAISAGLKQFFPKRLTPRQAQHFQVMAAMINGIVGSRKVQLSAKAGSSGLVAGYKTMRLNWISTLPRLPKGYWQGWHTNR